MAKTKITRAQKRFLAVHLGSRGKDGFLSRFEAHAQYDFVGRARDAGLIEIIDGDRGGKWPFSWKGTKITDLGRAILKEYGYG